MKVLVLAYHFPPCASSGTYRSLHLVNALARAGHEVTVLTAAEADHRPDCPSDPALLATIQPGVDVVRSPVPLLKDWPLALRNRLWRRRPGAGAPAGGGGGVGGGLGGGISGGRRRARPWSAFKDLVTGCMEVPDLEVGWLPGAVRRGLARIRAGGCDVIYASGSPWTAFVIGTSLKRRTGVPLVVDFRDPWVSNPMFRRKTGTERRLGAWLERRVVRTADRVVCNTEPLRRDFRTRFPGLPEGRCVTITNGFDAYVPAVGRGERLTITHAGGMYWPRSPKGLLQAVADLIEAGRVPADGIRIRLVGELTFGDAETAALADRAVAEGWLQLTDRVPNAEVGAILQASDVLCLIQHGYPLQVPRKLFDYLAFGKPLLAIVDGEGATEDLVRGHGLGAVVRDRRQEIGREVARLFADWEKGVLAGPRKEQCDPFLSDRIASRLIQVLADVARGETTGPPGPVG